MAQTLRWILIPPAAIAAWYAALLIGIATYRVVESFCPSDQMSSGGCFAPWFLTATNVLVGFGAAFAAVLVMISCTWLAPAHKRYVAIATFLVGSVVAIIMGNGSSKGFAPMMSAIIAGAIVLTIMLRRLAPFPPPNKSRERTRER